MNYFFFNRKLKRMVFFSVKSERLKKTTHKFLQLYTYCLYSLNAPTAEEINENGGMDDDDDDEEESR